MNLPNRLTMLRIILIPVFLVFVLVETIPLHYLWALAVFLAACFTDMLDGRIARSRGLVTDFGKLMDPLADKLLVMSALVAFIPVAGVPVWVVVLILGREFMVTSLRLIAAGKGVVIAADKWGKIKTISQMVWLNYTLLYLWLAPEKEPAHGLFLVLMGVVVLTTVASGFNYMWKNRSLYSEK